MRLEYLIKAYKKKSIELEIEEMNNEKERAGVIVFGNGISASYLLDEEDIIISMKIFINCLTLDEKNISNQFNHVIKVLKVLQETIMLLSNISQSETNIILDKLGLFDNTFSKGKQIKHIDHTYKAEIVQGLLCFSISEII